MRADHVEPQALRTLLAASPAGSPPRGRRRAETRERILRQAADRPAGERHVRRERQRARPARTCRRRSRAARRFAADLALEFRPELWPMVNFFIQRPIFASAIAMIMVLAGAICLLPAAGLAVSRHHAAAGRRQRQLSRRQRAGRRRHGHDAARTADQRRRGHDLHVLGEFERRLLDDHRHLRCRLSAQHRRRRRAEPRLAGRLVAARDRQSGRRDDQEAEPELRPDRQSDLARRFRRSGRRCAITPICRSSIR